VVATGAGALSYQWFLNGEPLTGATGASLALSNSTPANAGTYMVEVSDTNGTTRAAATLTVRITPFVLEDPQSRIAVVGDTVTFRVRGTGTEPLAYQWRSNSTRIGVFSPTNTSYTLVNVQTNHTANYTVILSNVVSSTILSKVARLTVLADTDGDGTPDVWESANGFNPMNSADAGLDADSDGVRNVDEYLGGTDPNDPGDYFEVDTISRAGSALLTFRARSNRTYTVQYNSDASLTGWSNLINIPFLSSNRVETIVDPSPAPGRLYRLLTPLQ
jgi:hypothetical protein